ncbi:DUF2129 domain-containing protein [Streptococcus chenjunshii]|uniref:UPF0298 protein DDV21_008790 n=1 Tax=Streptococcus chenjunshii TaxID=2173853 RepID=A0A372KM92_9STRE|nr:DUF2129 domain-containing protein [Streptococcus chenjunshii]AXQ79172.1 DUF2129 domain-containing protein [Streptococcus chenjunshii]RFU51005.1 DUF2129 domain-containing protein [Streptococcus chenjunshii]RFU53399.1 DUF2129 domain-containing protein [Streptococcus chenjunshii]
MLKKEDRQGIAVYLYYNRDARKLNRIGDIIYHSRRMRYLLIYVDKTVLADKLAELSRLKFVKEVKVSHLDDINCDFVGSLFREEKN